MKIKIPTRKEQKKRLEEISVHVLNNEDIETHAEYEVVHINNLILSGKLKDYELIGAEKDTGLIRSSDITQELQDEFENIYKKL